MQGWAAQRSHACIPSVYSLSRVWGGGLEGGCACICTHVRVRARLCERLGLRANVHAFMSRTLAQIMADHEDEEIDFLKIDIEWHEWAVLEDLLSQSDSPLFKVDQLCLEIHFNLNKETHTIQRSDIDILKTLAKHFEIFWRDDNFRFCPRQLWLPATLGFGYSIRQCHNVCYLRRRPESV